MPNGTVMATDEEEGIVLFDTSGNVVKKVKNPAWRKPRSPIYYKEHILVGDSTMKSQLFLLWLESSSLFNFSLHFHYIFVFCISFTRV
ncbi:unnamed protein product [Heligmosomoides polygyrus]|uniref:Uncharacterized protein n=1 Tax=Heligmosomoides polygyrus TaxID=6339 RepID=A0A3P7UCQ8_HELPZ|nr:unnamed protein product [Heligmosomoides polygyrus]